MLGAYILGPSSFFPRRVYKHTRVRVREWCVGPASCLSFSLVIRNEALARALLSLPRRAKLLFIARNSIDALVIFLRSLAYFRPLRIFALSGYCLRIEIMPALVFVLGWWFNYSLTDSTNLYMPNRSNESWGSSNAYYTNLNMYFSYNGLMIRIILKVWNFIKNNCCSFQYSKNLELKY